MSEETQHNSSHMHVLVITSMFFSQGFQSVFLLFFSTAWQSRHVWNLTVSDSVNVRTVGDLTRRVDTSVRCHH